MDQSSEASTLDALITRLQSGSPGSASGADRAAQRLVELAAAQRAPDRLRDPARILAQMQSPGSQGWRLRTPRPLLLVPFVALALAVIAAWPRLSTTEAVELIGRAEDVASGAAPLSTSSYTGTVTVQVRLSELSPFSSGASAQGQITETVHFSAPASVRVDIPGAASLISNGREGWLVDARAGTAQRLESAKLNAANPLNFADLPSFLRSLSRDYDVALAGTSLVAGREAQEVVLHSRAGSPAAATVRELRLFIDKALAIELKGEARSDTGEIVVAWEFIDFAANVAQDPALFAFVPGPGVRVIESTATTGSGVAGWRVVAARASFSTFAPVYLPGAVQDGYPSYDATTGTIVVAYRSAGRDALLLLERAAPAAHPLLPGSEVSVGGVRGFLERRDGRTYVRLDREGTRIELSAADGSGVGIEELLRIADGLRSVQR